MTTTAQKLSADKEARARLRAQLAEYLAGQPEATRSAHKWMKRMDVAGLGIIVAVFATALYGSFTWASFNPLLIPLAWFAFAASLSLMAMLMGLHAILIRAFPPVLLPGRPQKFVSGPSAVWLGVASLVGGLFMAIIWALFAYSTATFNLAMLIPLIKVLGAGMSIAIVAAIVYSIYQKASSTR